MHEGFDSKILDPRQPGQFNPQYLQSFGAFYQKYSLTHTHLCVFNSYRPLLYDPTPLTVKIILCFSGNVSGARDKIRHAAKTKQRTVGRCLRAVLEGKFGELLGGWSS